MATDDSETAKPTFVFTAGKAKGRAKPDDGDGLLVLKGSTALRRNTNSLSDRDRDERAQLLRMGVLGQHSDPDLYVFTCDHLFSSPSKAAGVIKDGNVSGPQSWLDLASKKTLKDYRGK